MHFARRLALPLAVAVAATGLAGCKQAEKPAAVASEAPDAKPGIAIKNARLVLPAVPGNPGAAYFDLENSSKGEVAIAAVAIAGAGKTEIHTADMRKVDTRIEEAGTTAHFAPGGVHVMAFDLSSALKAGDQTELTVTFTEGDKVSAQAKVEAMSAETMGSMPMGSEAAKP